MTVEQKIQAAAIISRANKHTLPYILKILGMDYTEKLQPPKRRRIDETVTTFIKECSDIDGKISSVVYASYRNYCIGREVEPVTHIEFSRQVANRLKLSTKVKRMNGGICHIFAQR